MYANKVIMNIAGDNDATTQERKRERERPRETDNYKDFPL